MDSDQHMSQGERHVEAVWEQGVLGGRRRAHDLPEMLVNVPQCIDYMWLSTFQQSTLPLSLSRTTFHYSVNLCVFLQLVFNS